MSPQEIEKLVRKIVSEQIRNHEHNQYDSKGIYVKNFLKLPYGTIPLITDTADGTYSANEQTMLANLKTDVNSLINLVQNSNT